MLEKKSIFGRQGFTLIEILVSITILAIILAVFFPFFSQAMANSVNNQKKMVAFNMAKEILYDFQQHSSNVNFTNKGTACMPGGTVEILPNTEKSEFPTNIYPELLKDNSLSDYYYEVNNERYYPDVTICQDSSTEHRLNLYKIHVQVFVYKGNSKVLVADIYSYIDKDLWKGG